jgi:transcriptional regulator with XRE-family HTH domain
MPRPTTLTTSGIYDGDEKRKKELMFQLGNRIKTAREEARMSQLQVGVALGVTDKTISGYESGRIAPPIDKLLVLADLFKKPITYFLGSDPREYKVSSRLRAVEVALRDIRKQLQEIKLLSQTKDLDS